jgi:phage shock protein A
MFQNLRQAFREAVDNFKEELNRDEVPELVDGLLRQMHREVTDAKAHLATLEGQIEEAARQADLEGEEVQTCLRREALARRIGDDETAEIAADFARKHERRKLIQERKALALREELEMRRGEVGEMLGQLKEARSRRQELSATAGRADAHRALSGSDDLFAELDRMAEKIEGIDRQREAEEDLLAEFDDLDSPPPPRRPSPEVEAEARLRELKRRMGLE